MNGRADLRLVTALIAAIGLSGCTPFGGSEGELGHGEFFYQCSLDGDIACDTNKAKLDVEITSADGAKLPRAVAVGAPFRLIFQSNQNGNVGNTNPMPASEALAPPMLLGFAIQKPVTVSFLATRSDGKVDDFIDVTAEEVATVNAFHEGLPVTKISLTEDQSWQVGAYARGASTTPLSGALPWDWSTSDPAVVDIGPEPRSTTENEISLHAVAPGSATLTIACVGKSLDIPVTVVAAN